MSIESGLREGGASSDKFQEGYGDLGSELTNLEKVFAESSPSAEAIQKLDPTRLSPDHLITTRDYLAQFSSDPKVGDMVMALNDKIDGIISLGRNKVRNAVFDNTQLAGNDDDYKLAV